MWGGSINRVEPPYKLWIVATKDMPSEVREEVDRVIAAINLRYERSRAEPEIKFQIDP